MQRKILISVIACVLLVSCFFMGGYIEASTSAVTKVISNGQSDISAAGYHKRDEIVDNADVNIENRMKETIDPILQAKTQEVEAMLEEYFNLKVDEMIANDTDDIEVALDTHVDTIFERYKADIDEIFGNY